MIGLVTAVLLSATPVRPETTIVLGKVERDLTGDGKPELLRLTGHGKTIDSLEVTLTIESQGRTVYRLASMLLTRRVGFDGDRTMRSAREQREYVNHFGEFIFAPGNFKSTPSFLDAWRSQAPEQAAEIPVNIARDGGFYPDTARGRAIWSEMERSHVTIFEFSPGGDGVIALGWSGREGRFFSLISCC